MMETGMAMSDDTQQLTRNYTVRQVTDYQVSWTQEEQGEEGVFTVQLILDRGVQEEVLMVDTDDLDVMLTLFKRSGHVMFDTDRRVLIFENMKPH
jgi:hypothetical protein